jgi:protein-S-isoprenylcysteine O-methyltransferase Ste14
LYVAPIRIGLGVMWLFLAQAAGATRASAVLAFGGGIFVLVFIAFNDPRTAVMKADEPRPAPADAVYAGPVEQALAATIPSTLGVTVLAAIAIWFQPTLAAILGGISAGLGVAGLLRWWQLPGDLWWDRRTKVLYRR